MDENKDSDVNIIDEDSSTTPHRSVTMSPSGDHSSTTSSSHVTKRKSTLSNEAVSEPRVKRLNTIGESDRTVSTKDLSQQLEQTKEKCAKKECVQERKHLSAYSAWVDTLKKENDMKDKKLDEKDKIIGSLETECYYKNEQLTAFSEQLQENAKTIHELELEFENKDKQLIEKSGLIEQLQKECADKGNQLKSNASTIKNLRSELESKNAQLTEKSTTKVEESKKNMQFAVINVEQLSGKDLIALRALVDQLINTPQSIKIEVEHSVENLQKTDNLSNRSIVHDKARTKTKQKSNAKSANHIAAKSSTEMSPMQGFAISNFQSVSKAVLSSIWQVIYDQAERAFRQPVDTEKFDDYLDVIKEPMDLGTIGKMISSNQITTLEEFYAKCMLVVNNAIAYTPDADEDVHRGALKLKEICEKEIERMFISSSANQEASSNENPAKLRRSSHRRY